MFTNTKKLARDVEEIKEVLTREKEGENSHLGSELDGKVEQKEFDEFKDRLFKPKKNSLSDIWTHIYFNYSSNQPSVSLEERIEALEKYLGIEFLNQTIEKREYVKSKPYIPLQEMVKKSTKKPGRPALSKKQKYMREWYRKNKVKKQRIINLLRK